MGVDQTNPKRKRGRTLRKTPVSQSLEAPALACASGYFWRKQLIQTDQLASPDDIAATAGVETRVGGVTEQRSNLTPLAEQWVEDFVAFRTRMLEIAREEFAARFAALKPKTVAARVRDRRA